MSGSFEHIQMLYEIGKIKSFKLLWLPVLARNEVVRSMDIHEIIKLSLCSRKMEGVVRYSKVKVNKIEIYVNIKNSNLQIESLNKDFYRCSPDYQKRGSKDLGPQIFSRWIDKDSTSFQNCVSILKHLQNMISFESLHLNVNFEGMTVDFFKEILTEPVLKDFQYLCLDEGKIDAECLDLVMETAHGNRDLYIRRTEVPEDYYHENAFKFYDIAYWDARWVRIEHLFSLEDRYSVSLELNKITYSDLNTYLKFWMESDFDMVRVLSIHTEVPIQAEILFDGIVVLQKSRTRVPMYLVAANPTKQRKYQMMGFVWSGNIINFLSRDLSDKQVLPSWDHEYKILMALNKKRELEKELERIQKLVETNQDENMVEKKNEISRELRNATDELASRNLVFRNGVYSYT